MIRYKLTIYNEETGEEIEWHDTAIFEDLEIHYRHFIEKHGKEIAETKF